MIKRKKKKLPGRRRCFIKYYPDQDDDLVAIVLVACTNLETVFPLLEGNFIPNDNELRRYKCIASGGLYLLNNVYYCSNTGVIWKYRGQGHGDYLYRALLLAARRHARSQGIKNWEFCCHAGVGSSTSASAWRCYKSLYRKRYLKKCSPHEELDRDCSFKVSKFPKNIPATFLMSESEPYD